MNLFPEQLYSGPFRRGQAELFPFVTYGAGFDTAQWMEDYNELVVVSEECMSPTTPPAKITGCAPGVAMRAGPSANRACVCDETDWLLSCDR